MSELAEEAAPVTVLGLIEGDVLTYLETHGATAARRLIRESSWSSPMVWMAIGALIRSGLVRAVRHDLEVIIEPTNAQDRTAMRRACVSSDAMGGSLLHR